MGVRIGFKVTSGFSCHVSCLLHLTLVIFCRLNITPPPSPVFGEKYNKKRPNKRPRKEDMEAKTTSTTTAATGNIQIIEADSNGNFIRLFNSGTQVRFYNFLY